MTFLVVLSFVASLSAAKAAGHLRSNVNMQPEQVANTLMTVQNEWKAQAHVFARCKATDELPVCKDAPNAFGESCRKVVGAVMLASNAADDVSEYMAAVCGQKMLSAWHKTKCNAVGDAIRSKMSGNPAENRQDYAFHAEKACTGVWSALIEEERKLYDLEVKSEEADAKDGQDVESEEEHAIKVQVKAEERTKAQLATEAQTKHGQVVKDTENQSSKTSSAHNASEQKVTDKNVEKKIEKKAQRLPGSKRDQVEIIITPSAPKVTAKVSARTIQAEMNHKRDLALLQISQSEAPVDELAKEMTHDLELNFQKIAPFGKEDTAKELQDHASKTQDTLVDAVENAEVAEIKRAVFRALTRLRAATIKEFDTIARLETQAIDAYNDAHHFRAENPLAHLHEDEAPVETDKLKSFH